VLDKLAEMLQNLIGAKRTCTALQLPEIVKSLGKVTPLQGRGDKWAQSGNNDFVNCWN